MNTFLWILVGFATCLGFLFAWNSFWSFSAQVPEDYRSETPVFDMRKQLGGKLIADGLVYDYRGRVSARFRAIMNGDFTDSGGTIAESFRYASGEQDQRRWSIKFDSKTEFTATAPDVIGEGKGTVSGNTVMMRYRIRLPERVGGHVLDATDWMYLLDDGTILNRSEMRKFGIKVAELFATMRRADAGGLQ